MEMGGGRITRIARHPRIQMGQPRCFHAVIKKRIDRALFDLAQSVLRPLFLCPALPYSSVQPFRQTKCVGIGGVRVVEFSAVLALFWFSADGLAGGQPLHQPSMALFAAQLFSELAILPRAWPYTANLLANRFFQNG